MYQLETDGIKVIIRKAATFGSRFFGLMGKREAPEGLWLIPCASIHTFMMRFDLDVIFLDKTMRIVSVHTGLRPGKGAFGGPGAYSAIEFPISMNLGEKLLPGMQITLQQL